MLTPGQARACVLTGLQDQLYKISTAVRAHRPRLTGEMRPESGPESALFLQRLSDANGGTGYLEPGWKLRHIEPTALVIGRNGFRLSASPGDCQLPPDTVPSSGAHGQLTAAQRTHRPHPQFLSRDGEPSVGDDAWKNLIRLYWNVTPDGALELMRLATCELNSLGVPFQLKLHTNLRVAFGVMAQCSISISRTTRMRAASWKYSS